MKLSDITEIKKIFNKYALDFKYYIVLVFLIQTFATLIISLQPMILAGVVESVTNNFQVQNIVYESSEQNIGSFFNLNTVGVKVRELTNNFFLINPDNPIIAVAILLSIYLLTVIFSSFLQFGGSIISHWIRFSTSVVIREKLMSHLLNLSVPYLNKSKSGELISRFVNDSENTAHGVGPLFNAFFVNTSLLIIYGTFLFSTSYLISFAAIALFLTQFLLMSIIRNPLRTRDSKVYDTKASLSSMIQEIFMNLRYIKIFNAEKYQKEEFNTKLKNIKDSEYSASIIKHIIDPIKLIIDNSALVGIVLVVSYFIFTNQITVTAAVIYIVVGRLIIPPINNFSVIFVWLQGVLVANSRVQEIIDTQVDIKSGNIEISDFDRINLNNINFKYENKVIGQKILSDVSFEINKGETIALVGPSGSGKSTIIDLIIRFYDPEDGSVTIDGNNIKDLEITSYRKMFGVVSQETILFNDTIENNIRLGRDHINFDKVVESGRISNSEEFINKLEKKYQTITGDRGVRLSGGQRQRISIARALFGNPKIIIFDEATSNLDSQSESMVQKGIENALEKSTAIIIAHRLSTIVKSDKIILMNDGKIESIGSHSQLLENSETYRKMCNQQFNDG